MPYKLIKGLEAAELRRFLFYLDGEDAEDPLSPNHDGVLDLPPINDHTSIGVGSEARVLTTGQKWVLGTDFTWILTPPTQTGGGGGGGDGIQDVPEIPLNETYSRVYGGWVPAISKDANNAITKGVDFGAFIDASTVAGEDAILRNKPVRDSTGSTTLLNNTQHLITENALPVKGATYKGISVVNTSGVAVIPATFNYSNVYYVDGNNPEDIATQDGSINHPYASINTLIAAHGGETNVLVYLHNSDLLDITPLHNISFGIVNWTFDGQNKAKVANISIDAASNNITLTNLIVLGDYEDASTNGENTDRHIIVNGNTSIQSGGWHHFEDSVANGSYTLHSGILDFNRSRMNASSMFIVTGGNALITNSDNLTLDQRNGTVLVFNSTFIPISQFAIDQTGGNILLFSGNAMNTDTSIGAIQLNGTSYSLGAFQYNPTTSTILGTEVLNGLQARQIRDTQTFTNIKPYVNPSATPLVPSQLQSAINLAIDTLIGEIQDDVEEALEVASSSKHYRGQLEYGTDTLDTMNSLKDLVTLENGDLCGVEETQKTYTYNSGTQTWTENSQEDDAVGDQYDIARWYGTYLGTEYTGNATATITCDRITPDIHFALIVSESTPVDQDTIKTVNGVNQVADRTVTYSADTTAFADGDLSFKNFFVGSINKINTLITNLAAKQNKLSASTDGHLVTHSGTEGVEGTPVNPAIFPQKATDFVTALSSTNKGLTAADIESAIFTDNFIELVQLEDDDYTISEIEEMINNKQSTNTSSVSLGIIDTNAAFDIVSFYSPNPCHIGPSLGSPNIVLLASQIKNSRGIEFHGIECDTSITVSNSDIRFYNCATINVLNIQEKSNIELDLDGTYTTINLSNGSVLLIKSTFIGEITGLTNTGGIVIDKRNNDDENLTTYLEDGDYLPIVTGNESRSLTAAAASKYFQNKINIMEPGNIIIEITDNGPLTFINYTIGDQGSISLRKNVSSITPTLIISNCNGFHFTNGSVLSYYNSVVVTNKSDVSFEGSRIQTLSVSNSVVNITHYDTLINTLNISRGGVVFISAGFQGTITTINNQGGMIVDWRDNGANNLTTYTRYLAAGGQAAALALSQLNPTIPVFYPDGVA